MLFSFSLRATKDWLSILINQIKVSVVENHVRLCSFSKKNQAQVLCVPLKHVPSEHRADLSIIDQILELRPTSSGQPQGSFC